MKEKEFITISCNRSKPAIEELPKNYSMAGVVSDEFIEHHFRKVCWLIANAYDNYKHEAYYTKGIYYDGQDRILSKTVMEAILNNEVVFKNVGSDNTFIFGIVKDGVNITIEVASSSMHDINIDIKSNITNHSKINREACFMLVKHVFETVFESNTSTAKSKEDTTSKLRDRYYNEDVFKRMVEENIKENHRNDNTLRLNKYGAKRLYQDEVDKVSDIPRCFIEDVIADGNDE